MGICREVFITFAHISDKNGVAMEILFPESRIQQSLICLENFRFSKIPIVQFTDRKSDTILLLEHFEKKYILNVSGETIALSENEIECILSMLLDYINQTAFVGLHYDFNTVQNGIDYSICFGVCD